MDVGLFCALPLGATVWCVRATRARGSIDTCALRARCACEWEVAGEREGTTVGRRRGRGSRRAREGAGRRARDSIPCISRVVTGCVTAIVSRRDV